MFALYVIKESGNLIVQEQMTNDLIVLQPNGDILSTVPGIPLKRQYSSTIALILDTVKNPTFSLNSVESSFVWFSGGSNITLVVAEPFSIYQLPGIIYEEPHSSKNNNLIYFPVSVVVDFYSSKLLLLYEHQFTDSQNDEVRGQTLGYSEGFKEYRDYKISDVFPSCKNNNI